MIPTGLRLARFFRVGASVHAVALSGDGRKLLVGSEHDLRLLDSSGRTHFRWGGAPVPGQWLDSGSRPFSAVALAPDLRAGLAVERTGRVHRLDFSNGGGNGRGNGGTNGGGNGHDQGANGGGDIRARATGLHSEPNDLYSLDFDHRRGQVALGHLGPDVTLIDADGEPLWRCRPGESESGGRGWSVGFGEDGQTVYAGCLFPARYARETPYLLAALNSETGEVRHALALSHAVTALTALPAPLSVATVQMNRGRCRVAAYGAQLGQPVWEHAWPRDEAVTVLAADLRHELVLAGTNTGHVRVLDACTGEVLHSHDLLYHSAVLAISAASDAQAVAVGLANGHVAYLADFGQD